MDYNELAVRCLRPLNLITDSFPMGLHMSMLSARVVIFHIMETSSALLAFCSGSSPVAPVRHARALMHAGIAN